MKQEVLDTLTERIDYSHVVRFLRKKISNVFPKMLKEDIIWEKKTLYCNKIKK